MSQVSNQNVFEIANKLTEINYEPYKILIIENVFNGQKGEIRRLLKKC
ncbi:hypothetical protein EHP00_2294 [Ecytonucleospora hepatopenaei]|uniref:Uncharacterized protein n=1 Tax=Ecytonucleospora hepatopenaei TaxID=646526 RepID=A0A1W0E3M9_9MICR|nr:hypothetical protein EHP00_2294 [Ecytonucleospora hepatopenaei]